MIRSDKRMLGFVKYKSFERCASFDKRVHKGVVRPHIAWSLAFYGQSI